MSVNHKFTKSTYTARPLPPNKYASFFQKKGAYRMFEDGAKSIDPPKEEKK